MLAGNDPRLRRRGERGCGIKRVDMRIALTADPELPVPPVHYGGIERIVDMLAVGLRARGHEVALFAHPDSTAPAWLHGWPGGRSRDPMDTLRNSLALASAVRRGGFDLVHSFSRIAYLTPLLPLPIPKLMTYQRSINPRTVALGYRLSRGTLHFSAISRWMMRGVENIGSWRYVPNGVPIATFAFRDAVPPNAPLAFLGRIEEIKGPHLAIEVAKRTGLDLVLAGNVPPEHRKWFDAHVAPHIDGTQIRYVGPVDDAEKDALLGRAAALLMPILWDEPFGIVMAEALACGTPVIGLDRGAVSEVVDDGLTGFVRADMDGLIEATRRIPELHRAACRAAVESRFSADVVVDGYVEIYREIVRRGHTR